MSNQKSELDQLIESYFQDKLKIEKARHKWLPPDEIKNDKRLKRAKRKLREFLNKHEVIE